MKNADMPAYPCDIEARVAQNNLGVDLNSAYEWHKASSGLTKREMLAMHFASALITNGNTYKGFIDDAILYADTLLKELDKHHAN